MKVRGIPLPSFDLPYQWIKSKTSVHTPKQAGTFEAAQLTAFWSMDDPSVLHIQRCIASGLMFYLGLRISEATFLTWGRVHQYLEKLEIRLRQTKSDQAGAGRTLTVVANTEHPAACIVKTFQDYYLLVPSELKSDNSRLLCQFRNGKFTNQPHGSMEPEATTAIATNPDDPAPQPKRIRVTIE